jgi:hypothetical protein
LALSLSLTAMSVQLRLREIAASVSHEFLEIDPKSKSQQWAVAVEASSGCARITIRDPFEQSPELGEDPEGSLKWLLETYASEPFEATRADLATASLSNYGRDLAAQIVKTGLLTKNGSIRLEIVSEDSGRGIDPNSSETTLQRLHWEVLEDTQLWPSEFSLNSVSVIRSVLRSGEQGGIGTEPFTGKKFNILLVVSRPGKQKDVDYQLVSRSLVAVVDHVSKTRSDTKVSLTILRPPTWAAFQKELQNQNYHLVHFDMKGRIRKASTGHASYVEIFLLCILSGPYLFLIELVSSSASPIIWIPSK